MSGFTLHFVGGPLDGQKIQWYEAPPTYRVPSHPFISFEEASASAAVIPPTEVYERRPGVVAAEAVYDWKGQA